MSYYIRVLSPSDEFVTHTFLNSKLIAKHPNAILTVKEGSKEQWKQLLLRHPNGSEIAVVERNSTSGELANEEIEEFIEAMSDCLPQSSVEWLCNYLPTVRTIYSFQILSGTESEKGWEILGSLKSAVWRQVSGIIQADGEGFTNEDGYHILWQFSEAVKGNWWMGVLENGQWVHFQMDLGNRKQRESFFRGTIPAGARRA